MTTSTALDGSIGEGPLKEKWVEFFSLRGLTSRARKVPDDAKKQVSKDLRLARQKREAAEALWRTGFTAEGLRLALDGFRGAVRGCTQLREVGFGSTPDLAEVLRELGVKPGEIRDVVRAETIASNDQVPVFDSDMTASHEDDFRLVLEATESLENSCGAVCLSPREISRRRLKRVFLTAVSVCTFGGAAWWLLAPKHMIEAEASTYWGNVSDFAPANVLDGVESTEWLASDAQIGTLTLRLSPAREVKAIKILNAHNRQANDRASKDFSVELFSSGRSVRTVKSSFPEFQEVPLWKTVEISGSSIDMIRITVSTWHRAGVGFAEVRVIER